MTQIETMIFANAYSVVTEFLTHQSRRFCIKIALAHDTPVDGVFGLNSLDPFIQFLSLHIGKKDAPWENVRRDGMPFQVIFC
jgi:hypothetical protein